MQSKIQEVAKNKRVSFNQFIGTMRIYGISEPTARKLWKGDQNVMLKNIEIAAKVLGVKTGELMN